MRAVFALFLARSLAGEPVSDTVYVGEVDGQGGVNEVARNKVEAAVREGLGRGRLRVHNDADTARYLLQTTVTLEGRDYQFRLVLTDADTGEVLAETTDGCDICGVDEAADLIGGAAALLGQQVHQLDIGPPKLLVTSTPEKATVFIDGAEVGLTPYEGELAPGPHVVRLQKPGHVTVEREMELATGVHSTADFLLEREGPAAPVLATDRAFILGWVGVAAGAASLGGGIALLALDGREYGPRCGPENQDGDGDCKFVLETKWGGAAATTVGAILATTGVALILAAHRRRGGGKSGRFSPRPSPPAASWSAGGSSRPSEKALSDHDVVRKRFFTRAVETRKAGYRIFPIPC